MTAIRCMADLHEYDDRDLNEFVLVFNPDLGRICNWIAG